MCTIFGRLGREFAFLAKWIVEMVPPESNVRIGIDSFKDLCFISHHGYKAKSFIWSIQNCPKNLQNLSGNLTKDEL